jgi:hypothetical protein
VTVEPEQHGISSLFSSAEQSMAHKIVKALQNSTVTDDKLLASAAMIMPSHRHVLPRMQELCAKAAERRQANMAEATATQSCSSDEGRQQSTTLSTTMKHQYSSSLSASTSLHQDRPSHVQQRNTSIVLMDSMASDTKSTDVKSGVSNGKCNNRNSVVVVCLVESESETE